MRLHSSNFAECYRRQPQALWSEMLGTLVYKYQYPTVLTFPSKEVHINMSDRKNTHTNDYKHAIQNSVFIVVELPSTCGSSFLQKAKTPRVLVHKCGPHWFSLSNEGKKNKQTTATTRAR